MVIILNENNLFVSLVKTFCSLFCKVLYHTKQALWFSFLLSSHIDLYWVDIYKLERKLNHLLQNSGIHCLSPFQCLIDLVFSIMRSPSSLLNHESCSHLNNYCRYYHYKNCYCRCSYPDFPRYDSSNHQTRKRFHGLIWSYPNRPFYPHPNWVGHPAVLQYTKRKEMWVAAKAIISVNMLYWGVDLLEQ